MGEGREWGGAQEGERALAGLAVYYITLYNTLFYVIYIRLSCHQYVQQDMYYVRSHA